MHRWPRRCIAGSRRISGVRPNEKTRIVVYARNTPLEFFPFAYHWIVDLAFRAAEDGVATACQKEVIGK